MIMLCSKVLGAAPAGLCCERRPLKPLKIVQCKRCYKEDIAENQATARCLIDQKCTISECRLDKLPNRSLSLCISRSTESLVVEFATPGTEGGPSGAQHLLVRLHRQQVTRMLRVSVTLDMDSTANMFTSQARHKSNRRDDEQAR